LAAPQAGTVCLIGIDHANNTVVAQRWRRYPVHPVNPVKQKMEPSTISFEQ
jgi:hypothetical protein